jgi:hypothetical protein
MTYEQALQIAMEELDEKIKVLSDTFQGHSARIETYIYDLSMARKALMQASGEKREWVGLTKDEVADICESHYKYSKKVDLMVLNVFAHSRELEAKLKEKNT